MPGFFYREVAPGVNTLEPHRLAGCRPEDKPAALTAVPVMTTSLLILIDSPTLRLSISSPLLRARERHRRPIRPDIRADAFVIPQQLT